MLESTIEYTIISRFNFYDGVNQAYRIKYIGEATSKEMVYTRGTITMALIRNFMPMQDV